VCVVISSNPWGARVVLIIVAHVVVPYSIWKGCCLCGSYFVVCVVHIVALISVCVEHVKRLVLLEAQSNTTRHTNCIKQHDMMRAWTTLATQAAATATITIG
jgi:hypothetical protein